MIMSSPGDGIDDILSPFKQNSNYGPNSGIEMKSNRTDDKRKYRFSSANNILTTDPRKNAIMDNIMGQGAGLNHN